MTDCIDCGGSLYWWEREINSPAEPDEHLCFKCLMEWVGVDDMREELNLVFEELKRTAKRGRTRKEQLELDL